ncbi:Ig-like domain-containing protein [Xenorhabdus bovienii]|uniref:Uncharacterized protein n=1 Tax=Xenorhabdus bovienii TaxID=40576 RepID=A0A0B6XAZ2_XENBV|nr:Ig-like domain-containing protein [Xenorhabdus bovienii]CDM89903.1 protein of unknown function [Xenorhabdus bovienii]
MDQTISGYAGEEKPLNISVSAKYGLERIDWKLAELTANGGKIENDGGYYRILLPDYQYSHTDPTSVAATGDHKVKNTYSVSAVAIDKKGNRSNPVHMQVIVSSAAINTVNSLFSPEKSELAAEGKSTQKLTLTIKDKMNQPVDVNVEEFRVKMNERAKRAEIKVLATELMKIDPDLTGLDEQLYQGHTKNIKWISLVLPLSTHLWLEERVKGSNRTKAEELKLLCFWMQQKES